MTSGPKGKETAPKDSGVEVPESSSEPVERPRNMPRPGRRYGDRALRPDRRGPGGYDTKG